MKVIQTVKSIKQEISSARTAGKRIGYLCTTGSLHEGHAYLISVLRRHADFIVVSNAGHLVIGGYREDWINPNPSTEKDIEVLKQAGAEVDVFFAVTGKELYPAGYHDHTIVEVRGVSEGLCNDRRPGFFRMISTPVLMMFNVITPDVTVFGEKDYQQYAVIKKMVRDLHLPIDVIPAPTVRYGNGLALASRNKVFSPEQLNTAVEMFNAMNYIRQGILSGRRDYDDMIEHAKGMMMDVGMTPDYIDIREPETLRKVDGTSTEWIVFGAAYYGPDRLVDTLRVLEVLPDPVLKEGKDV